MKRAFLIAAAFLCSILLMGAAETPVQQAKGLYVNDYASLLFDAHRSALLTVSRDLYDRTGVSVLVLTVDSLQGISAGEYGEAIMRGWQLDDRSVLLLVAPDDRLSRVLIGEGLPGLADYKVPDIKFGDGSLSRPIMDLYTPLVLELYSQEGIEPGADIMELLEPAETSSGGPFTTGAVIFLAVVLLATGRSIRVSRKYRQKYLKGHVRKVKSFTRTYNEEDAYKNDKIYRIDHDDMD